VSKVKAANSASYPARLILFDKRPMEVGASL